MPLNIQGRRLEANDAPDARLLPRKQAPGREIFDLAHHPKKWVFLDVTGEWLPSISEIRFSPGVNGCRALPDGPDGQKRMDCSVTRAAWRRKGGTVIDSHDHRLGEFKGYVQVVTNDAGRKVHFSIFESFDVVGQDVIWNHEEDHFNRFRRLLLSSGLLHPIHDAIKRQEIAKTEFAVTDLRKRYGKSPSHEGLATELETMSGRLRAMQTGTSTPEAIAKNKAERRAELLADAAVPTAAPAQAPVPQGRTIDAELVEARAALAEYKASHPEIYVKVIGRKRPGVSALPRVRDFLARVEDAIDEAETVAKDPQQAPVEPEKQSA